jgi:hypothetical protein
MVPLNQGLFADTQAAVVRKLEMLGERDLIDIETSTHTFFANGLQPTIVMLLLLRSVFGV